MRRWGLAAAVILVLVVAVGVGALVAGGVLRAWRATPGRAGAVPHFVDETKASGLDHTYGASDTAMIGGGLAVLDCDNNGLPDLFIAGGANPSALFRNASRRGGPLAFVPVTDAGTFGPNVMGAYPIDIDGDGLVDLAVLRVGEVDLMRGLGGCRFEQANQRWSFAAPATWTTAFSATWEGAARLPTLAVGSYVGLDASGNATYTCPDNELFRPAADGSGYAGATSLTPGYCTLSMLFSDWNRSGRQDLRVANDRHYYATTNGQEQLWQVLPGAAPHLYTADEGWVSMQIWGMGIASHDLNGDGYPDVYLTSQGDNKLQTLTSGPDQPTYRDIALKRGVNSAVPFTGGDILPSTSWDPEFTDVNNDGFADLFVSKGNIGKDPTQAQKDPSDLFLGRSDGTFSEAADAAGVLSFDRGRGATLADLNGDGLPDLVLVSLGAPVRAWRNVGSGTADAPAAMGHWLDVALVQPGGNRDAVGAWIEVRVSDTVQRNEVTIGGGHVGGTLGAAHFGLGAATSAEVRVQWPDGQQGAWQAAPVDGVVTVDRASGTMAVRPSAGP